MAFRRIVVFSLTALLLVTAVKGQSSGTGDVTGKVLGAFNTIQTTVPFLTIAPDSRGGGMGDLGVATTPDVNSQHWNAAKYPFLDRQAGISLAYTPWLRNLVNDINLAYLSGYYNFDGKQAVSASLKYFSLGEVIFTDDIGLNIGNYTPNEFAVDAGYSRLLSDYFSGALVIRFIRSDITGGGSSYDQQQYSAGYSFAADLAMYYQHPVNLADLDGEFAWGLNFSNLGSKISYTEGSDKQFIPANMRTGVRYSLDIDDYNSLTASLDLNKLLVPTPPVRDSLDHVQFGKETPKSLPLSWIQSFYDAPAGFKEEIHEITYSFGLEYLYREQFAMRAGYHYEHETKGNRKFFAVGIGLNLNVFFIDFSYLISRSGRSNPLANTMRFTIGMNFD
jgi:hypothetical protein